jgi:hypothetical protein
MAQNDPEDYPIWGYASWNEFRDPLAAFVGCTRDEIALVRNSTEANSYICNGLDFSAGDEVVMTDQEHPGGEQAFNLRAKRHGIVVKKVTLPKPVPNAAAALNLFNDAITPRTKLIFFSHITTATGVVLPVKEICALARSKGILSAVDGAHVIGMMKLNVHDLGCDMYSSSPHKWLQGPKGTGFLCVRDEVMDRVWNTIVTTPMGRPKLGRSDSNESEFERAGAVWFARGGATPEFDRDGADRAAASDDGGLHFEGDGEAGSGVVDVAGSGDAVRDCVGERAADTDWRAGDVDVEREEDPDSGRRAVEDTAIHTVLFVAEGCGQVPGVV